MSTLREVIEHYKNQGRQKLAGAGGEKAPTRSVMQDPKTNIDAAFVEKLASGLEKLAEEAVANVSGPDSTTLGITQPSKGDQVKPEGGEPLPAPTQGPSPGNPSPTAMNTDLSDKAETEVADYGVQTTTGTNPEMETKAAAAKAEWIRDVHLLTRKLAAGEQIDGMTADADLPLAGNGGRDLPITQGGEPGGTTITNIEGNTAPLASNQAAIDAEHGLQQAQEKADAAAYLDHPADPKATTAPVETVIGEPKTAADKRAALAKIAATQQGAEIVQQARTKTAGQQLTQEDLARLRAYVSQPAAK